MEKRTSSQPSSGPPYEVFLSFRGLDTRYEFTDFLYRSMIDAGILVFRDAESLRVGKRIGGELLQAIEQSKIYIPIFSRKYASSRWCLRELTCMVECTSKSNENKVILPIFLNVEPIDVKLKTNLYSQALSEHQRKFSIEVESWKRALVEVGEIKGWNWEKNESQADLIQSVVQTVLAKLNVRFKKNVTEDLVGVDDHVETIIKMLDVESAGVQFLGIHGMGGIGKTTLAKVIFNTISSHFQGCNFLSDVRESSRRHGLVYLQKQLLSTFIGSRSTDRIYDVDDGINMIKRVFCNKKVLIILDDVNGKEQLKSLAEKQNWFGSGSRIIVTTRDLSVLMIEGEAAGEGSAKKFANILTYEVREMEFAHALKLFSRHAFRRDSPPDHFVYLSKVIVSTLGKLPLALEVTGSSLNGKSEALWVETWKKLQKAPPMEVQKTLMITYERLDHAQRQVFLDIACFFVNWEKTYPFYMWEACGYHPHDALEVLFLMSFVKIKDDDTFWMHDQVRDLGKEIVRQENCENPNERSRVWSCDEALSIMTQKEGSRKIEAMSLGYLGFDEDFLTRDKFANLQNLRFFEGDGVFLVGDFKNLLSSLTWLSWHYCPYEFEATNFHLSKLTVLDFSGSFISEEWMGWNQIRAANKLKVLDLSDCENLTRTVDLSTFVSLERLILKGCRQLIEIDPSIGKLKLLTVLNLDGCDSLRGLPEEIGCLQVLTEIVTPPLRKKFRLPKMLNLRSLLTLDVSYRQISELPYSIGRLVKLRRLILSHTEIKELPNSIGNLQSLVELDLSWTGIGHLPDSIGNLRELKVFRMRHISQMTILPSAIGLMEKLEELDACQCFNLTGKIPEGIGRLFYLKILDLSFTRITGLPTTVSRLSNLQALNLQPCPELKQLPELPPSITCLRWARDDGWDISIGLTLWEMERVTGLPTITDTLSQLETLVTAVPANIGALSQLETLTLSCKNVQFLPQLPSSLRKLKLVDLATTRSPGFSNLKNLSTLLFYGCSMPEFSGIFDAELEVLRIEFCTFGELDALFQLEMKRLRSLAILWCEFLPEALDLSHMKNLQELFLLKCEFLVEIRGLEESGSLCSLCVDDCSSIERISDLSKLGKLRKFKVGACPKLRSVEGLNQFEPVQDFEIFNAGGLEVSVTPQICN